MRQHIGEKDGAPLNINKKIMKKSFKNWKRNLVEINKSKHSEGSERTINEVQKATKKEKTKKKLAEVEEEESQRSATPETSANIAEQAFEKRDK